MASSRQHLLLLFGTILLVQSSLGKALPLDETTTTLETSDVTTGKPIIPQTSGEKVLYYILSEFSKVADSTLKIGKKLLEDVIAEISGQDEKSEETNERLDKFSDMATDIDVLYAEYGDDFVDFFINFKLVNDLNDLLELSKITSIDEPTGTDKLFAKALENNGLSSYEKLFENKFTEIFSNEFYTAAKRILNSYTTEEWSEKENAQQWLEKLNAENNVNEKIDLLHHVYDFY